MTKELLDPAQIEKHNKSTCVFKEISKISITDKARKEIRDYRLDDEGEFIATNLILFTDPYKSKLHPHNHNKWKTPKKASLIFFKKLKSH